MPQHARGGVLLLLAAAVLLCTAFSCATATPLDDYIAMEDGYFSWTNTGVHFAGGGSDAADATWDGYVYNMTSQQWLTAADVNRPIWWHWLVVIIPRALHPNVSGKALLYISAEGNDHPERLPTADSGHLFVATNLSVASGTPAAVLYQVPNQPLSFPCNPFGPAQALDADTAIALTWWHYIQVNASAPEWILELPMTKAGVKALDALEHIIPQYTNGAPCTQFGVTGESKRGWTAWLVAAADPKRATRILATIPIVLDALDLITFAHRQFQFYGAWTFAFKPYVLYNFTANLDRPETLAMTQIIDPYFYRDRLTMPKLTINAVGDEFQMPDDHRYWAHAMPGEMNLLMLKNAEHDLFSGVRELYQSAGAFWEAVLHDTPRPNYTWAIDNVTGRITVTTNVVPSVVTVAYSWSGEGVSAGKRDFRWAAINATPCWQQVSASGACLRPLLWLTTNATKVNDFTYTALLDTPVDGWLGFFMELQWPNPLGGKAFYFSSPTSVIPNTLPFKDCHGEACRGTLV